MAASNATAQPEMERLQKATQNEEAVAASTPAPGPIMDSLDPNHEEYQYLNLIRKIIDEGEQRPDRYFLPPHLSSIHF